MTVAELIEELKKYPQDLQIASSMSDCSACADLEIVDATDISETVKSDYNFSTHQYDTTPVLKIGY